MTSISIPHSSLLADQILPSVYGRWIDQLLEDSIPKEQAATCDACAMCFHDNSESKSAAFYFNPSIKCCTYIPDLANFLLGAVLSNTDENLSQGRRSIARRLAAGIGVTPLGLFPSPTYTQIYRNSPAAFGRSQTLSCPHYVSETGRCSIWEYRPPPCSTWFCKHNRGAVGRDFWRELNLLLMAAQQNVALWCMAKLDMDIEVMRAVLNQPQKNDSEVSLYGEIPIGVTDKDGLRAVWGNWFGRYEEFYQRCAELTEGLEWQSVESLCGPEVKIRAQIVKAAHQKLNTRNVPSRLRTTDFKIVNSSQNHVKVMTYSPYDLLDIPKQVLEGLSYFNGRSLIEALDIISRQKNIPINSKVLNSLVDFDVLAEEHADSDPFYRSPIAIK